MHTFTYIYIYIQTYIHTYIHTYIYRSSEMFLVSTYFRSRSRWLLLSGVRGRVALTESISVATATATIVRGCPFTHPPSHP